MKRDAGDWSRGRELEGEKGKRNGGRIFWEKKEILNPVIYVVKVVA